MKPLTLKEQEIDLRNKPQIPSPHKDEAQRNGGKKLRTTVEASQEVPPLSPVEIMNLCHAGKVSCQRRSAKKGSRYLLGQEDIDALKEFVKIRKQRRKTPCRICRNKFTHNHHSQVICWRKSCQKENRKRKDLDSRKRLLAQKPTAESLNGWQAQLLKRLKSHVLPKHEKRITIVKAVGITGLTAIKIWWLGKRRIVTTRHHPTKQWRGKPVVLYSPSEMAIARQAHQDYHKQKKTD